MVFLINASNIQQGGAVQVALSIIGQLKKFSQHRFVLVLSSHIKDAIIGYHDNIKVVKYDLGNSLVTLVLGRNQFLDSLVSSEEVDAVLTIFGPSKWLPRVPHLCGFARAQLVLKDSPYYQRATLKEKIIFKVWEWAFKRSSNTFYTENQLISNKLSNLLKSKTVYTVSNYYNQIFDEPSEWQEYTLPVFDGITCLTISGYAEYKNFSILIPAADYLKKHYPDFHFRFVLTFDSKLLKVPNSLKCHFLFIGPVCINACPSLYRQADLMVMPSLMECFSATYAEAMRMEVPIVTTDLDFAHSLCNSAACYYDAMNPEAAAEAIYRVATNHEYSADLVANGIKQLKTFDNYEQRASKLISIMETLLPQQ